MSYAVDNERILDQCGLQVANLPEGSPEQRAKMIEYIQFYEGPYTMALFSEGRLSSFNYLTTTPRTHVYAHFLRELLEGEIGALLVHPAHR